MRHKKLDQNENKTCLLAKQKMKIATTVGLITMSQYQPRNASLLFYSLLRWLAL